MPTKLLVILSVLPLLGFSCGGVVGNMEKYRFENHSIQELKAAVEKVYSKHPAFRDFDTTKYKKGRDLGDATYYCRINASEGDYLFAYAYPQYPPPGDSIVEIALTTAAPYGKPVRLAKDIGFFEQKKYRALFKKYFMAEIQKELNKPAKSYPSGMIRPDSHSHPIYLFWLPGH